MNISPNLSASQRLFRQDGPWLVLALLLVGSILFGLWRMPQRINHDSAGLLHGAEMVLDGAVPYCDYADIGPPLIVYLSVLPVALGRILGISAIVMYNVLVIGLLLLSSLEMFILSKRRRMSLPAMGRGLTLLCWIALFFAFDIRGDAGQREHLFVLLYFPYLFLRILRHRSGSVAGWFATLLGIQAGIGVSLKPHFLLAAMCVELVLLLATRRWRTLLRAENFALASVVAAYVLHWLFVPAAMRDAYFFRWVPLAARGYGAYNMSYHDILQSLYSSPISLAALAAVAVAAMLLARRRSRLRLPLLALVVLTGAGLFIFFVQHKGFTYHRIPFESAGLLCLAMLASTVTRPAASGEGSRTTTRVGRFTAYLPGRAAFLFLVALGLLLATWFTERSYAHADLPEFDALWRIVQQRSQPGERVLIIATSVRPAYPMLMQLGRKPGSRYGCAMPLAFLYADAAPAGNGRLIYHRPDEAPAEERQYLREMGDDVARLQPRLIIVNDSPGWQGLPDGFNTYDYLVYTGWTNDALKPYHELRGPKGWKVFER